MKIDKEIEKAEEDLKRIREKLRTKESFEILNLADEIIRNNGNEPAIYKIIQIIKDMNQELCMLEIERAEAKAQENWYLEKKISLIQQNIIKTQGILKNKIPKLEENH